MSWILARLGRGFITLLLLVAFCFFTLSAGTDLAIHYLGPEADDAQLEAFRRKWGLDQPLWTQFLIYLDGLTRLDFGTSIRSGEPALAIVMDRVPWTLSLMLPSIFFAIALGCFVGFVSAQRRGQAVDQTATALVVVGLAVPNFFVGILLITFFSVWLGALPPSGYVDWTSYVMPVIALSTASAALFARFTRSATVEIMAHPMMETARAGGLSEGTIRRFHTMPNVALPLVTVTALEFGNVFTAAVVTETVFGWPGTGRLFIESVRARDLAVVQTIVILTGGMMILANLLADLAYGWIDPRIADLRKRKRRATEAET